MEEIRMAQAKGLKVYGETCPQYLFLTLDDLDRDGMDGAMYCCSPPPRDKAGQEGTGFRQACSRCSPRTMRRTALMRPAS